MSSFSELEKASICYACNHYDSDLREGLCRDCLAHQEIEDGSRDDVDDDDVDDDDYDPYYPLM